MASAKTLLLSLAAVFALSSAACGGATTQSSSSKMLVKTNGAVVSNVARHKTYSHETAAQPPVGYVPTRMTPAVLDKVRQDIDADLQRKGYVLANDGELVVRISQGVRSVREEPTGSSAVAGAPEIPDTRSALVIDVFERATNGHLFHGFARDDVDPTTIDEKKLNEAVTKILAPLPESGQVRE